jgi:hypothetical protein
MRYIGGQNQQDVGIAAVAVRYSEEHLEIQNLKH